MNKTTSFLLLLISIMFLISCENKEMENQTETQTLPKTPNKMEANDERISLGLNSMQKQHQLKNMRSHLDAIQQIINLLAKEQYDEASKIAYTKLGSTTEMRLMCASFGNEEFEKMGLNFHKSADEASEIFKTKDKNKSLEALSNTMNYCVQCHSAFRQ